MESNLENSELAENQQKKPAAIRKTNVNNRIVSNRFDDSSTPILITLKNDIPRETKATAYLKSNIDPKYKPNMEKNELGSVDICLG